MSLTTLKSKSLDWATIAAMDLRAALLMSDATVDPEPAPATLSGYTDLDELDAVGYARKTLANVALVEDGGNNKIQLQADDLVCAAKVLTTHGGVELTTHGGESLTTYGALLKNAGNRSFVNLEQVWAEQRTWPFTNILRSMRPWGGGGHSSICLRHRRSGCCGCRGLDH